MFQELVGEALTEEVMKGRQMEEAGLSGSVSRCAVIYPYISLLNIYCVAILTNA